MKTTEFIQMQMGSSQGWIGAILADMQDAPLTAPTPKGGNHPLWVVGHMAYSDANLFHAFIQGKENPLVSWKELFGKGSQPVDDAQKYPPFEEVLAKFEAGRAEILAFVGTLSDDVLDKPSHAPEEYKDFFGTVGQVLAMMTSHLAFHGGQVADARRAAGRDILMA